MFEKTKQKLKSFGSWIKAKWKKLLCVLGIGVVIAYAAGDLIPDTTFLDLAVNTAIYADYATTSQATEQFEQRGNAFKTSKGNIDTYIGNPNADDFRPDLTIQKWNEAGFRMKLPKNAYKGTQSLSFKDRKQGKATTTEITWQDNNLKIEVYQLPVDNINEDGGIEYGIYLKKKPTNNVITFDIETKNLDFFYQPALTQEEIDRGAYRPENVVGSYAVYYKEGKSGDFSAVGGQNYKTGKAFHLYRPEVIDALGNKTWADYNTDVQETGKLSITPDPLAVYPIYIDPTFGYTTSGVNTGAMAVDAAWGSRFYLGAAGSFSKITLRTDNSGDNVKGLIWDGVSNLIMATGASYNSSAFAWWDSTINPEVVLSTGWYYIGAIPAGSNTSLYYDTTTNWQQGFQDHTNPYATPETLVVTSIASRKYSIYATYTSNTCPSPSSFSYYKKLTLLDGWVAGGVATTTSNGFVILASTTDTNLTATSSGGRIQNVYNNKPLDICFYDDDQQTAIPFEIEKYSSSTGRIIAWIKSPDVSSTTDKDIYMYYGYTGGLGYEDSESVWSTTTYPYTQGVWHLKESTSTDAYAYDSTANHNNGTMTNTNYDDQVEGQVDGALSFDGTNDYVTMGSNTLAPDTAFTVSAWFKTNGAGSGSVYHTIRLKGTTEFVMPFGGSVSGVNGIYFGFRGMTSMVGGTVLENANNVWRYVTITFNGGNKSDTASWKLYENGVSVSISTYNTIGGSTNANEIGRDGGGGSWLNGLIDDVRIYNRVLTAADIATDYNMGNNWKNFITWGAETSTAAGAEGTEKGTGFIWFED